MEFKSETLSCELCPSLVVVSVSSLSVACSRFLSNLVVMLPMAVYPGNHDAQK